MFFGSETMNRVAVKGILHGKNHASGGATPRNLFNHDGVGDVVEARAAFSLRERDRRQTKFRRFFEQGAWKVPGLVVLLRQRADFRLRKLAHALLQQVLFFCQFKVQLGALLSSQGLECQYFNASGPLAG